MNLTTYLMLTDYYLDLSIDCNRYTNAGAYYYVWKLHSICTYNFNNILDYTQGVNRNARREDF